MKLHILTGSERAMMKSSCGQGYSARVAGMNPIRGDNFTQYSHSYTLCKYW